MLGSAAIGVLCCSLPLPPRFDDLLRSGPTQAAAGGPAGAAVLVVASCVVWPLLAWACLVLVLGVAARLPGGAGRSAGRALRRALPAALRQVLVAGLGVSIGVGTLACGATGSTSGGSNSASSAPGGSTAPATGQARVAAPEGGVAARVEAGGALAGLQFDWPTASGPARLAVVTTLPDLDWPAASSGPASAPGPSAPAAPGGRPTSSAQTTREPAADRPGPQPAAPTNGPSDIPATGRPIIVRPGDTLWAIAAAHLPAGTDDAQIDRSWRAWYVANATVIGPDADLILPGQQLLPPTPKDAS